MTLDELEEAISEILSSSFQIETDSHGEIIIRTGLTKEEDGDGELIDFERDEEDEDPDFDPDTEPLEDEDIGDEV